MATRKPSRMRAALARQWELIRYAHQFKRGVTIQQIMAHTGAKRATAGELRAAAAQYAETDRKQSAAPQGNGRTPASQPR